MWKKYGTRIWDVGHKTVTLFQGASKIPLHTTLWMTGDGIQTHHVRVPRVKWVPVSARNIIQTYLNVVDWRHIQTGGPSGRHQELVYLPKLHPMSGTSDSEIHPVTGSERVNKMPHIRTTQPDTVERVGGSQGTP